MRLMRIVDDRVAEIVDAPDEVTRLDEAGVETTRPATQDDFFPPEAGFLAAKPAGVGAVFSTTTR